MNKNSFIYQSHCENGSPSSKRLYGGIGWMTVQLCIIAATVLSLCLTQELSITIKDLLEMDLIVSASLLGLSTITGVFGKRQISIGKEEKKEEPKKERPEMINE